MYHLKVCDISHAHYNATTLCDVHAYITNACYRAYVQPRLQIIEQIII